MNLRLLAALAVLVTVVVAVTRVAPFPAALVLSLLAALLATLALEHAASRRLRHLAEEVNRWLGRDEHTPVELGGNEAWQELAIALNALGAAYHRRGGRLDRERPWRREFVDALASPALLFSGESRLLAANRAARSLLGIAVDAHEPTAVQALGSGALVAAVEEVRSAGQPVTVDTQHRDRELRSRVTLVGDETLVIITDRTRELRVEELRRNFVVNASHELKTPVTSMQTLAEALDITVRNDPDRVPSLVGRLREESERLAVLVYDLLDLRRLEERGAQERVPVDLAELVRQAVVAVLDDAEAADVEVEVHVPDRAMVAGVVGDLRLIVKNLLTNAIKYNRPGGRAEVTLESAPGEQVLIVRDTGIGIPRQDLGRIFERFYRVDLARSRDTGGTGLGLSIVRHAVERHGGTIGVDSLLGEGTTFTVRLPVGPN